MESTAILIPQRNVLRVMSEVPLLLFLEIRIRLSLCSFFLMHSEILLGSSSLQIGPIGMKSKTKLKARTLQY